MIDIVVILIFLVVGAYIFGIGYLGNTELSFKASDWVDFSSFFNGMLSPILAALAAAIAFISLTQQLRESRKDASLNEQIGNYLNHINLLQGMIDKRWQTISKVNQTDWETEPFFAINRHNISESLVKSAYLSAEVVTLCKFMQDLTEAVQWYTQLHKQKLDLYSQEFPKKEWAHFSTSLVREQDKKMRYCYEYCLWMLEEPNEFTKKYKDELIIFQAFYEGLVRGGTLYEP
ncbi:hypothetical protein [Vibrio coralliirubri]|uniref:hypothetical protein n=1 Tax=Vibrio coralliirubri TaxID=1516159 RepID=UPI00118764DB|nr:hypothetical protein [Vibrio coralliirubri]